MCPPRIFRNASRNRNNSCMIFIRYALSHLSSCDYQHTNGSRDER